VQKKQSLDLPFPKALRADFNSSMVELPRTGVFSSSRKMRSTRRGDSRPATSKSMSFPSLASTGGDGNAKGTDFEAAQRSVRSARSPDREGAASARAPSARPGTSSSRVPSASTKLGASTKNVNPNALSQDSVGSFSLDSAVLNAPMTPSNNLTSANLKMGSAPSPRSEDEDDDDDYDRANLNTAKTNKSEGGDNTGFYKVCALCEQRHPRRAMEISVLWKHVLNLR
jgi:hypothetical protein